MSGPRVWLVNYCLMIRVHRTVKVIFFFLTFMGILGNRNENGDFVIEENLGT